MLEEDQEYFLVGNMRNEDIPYFVSLATNQLKEDGTNLNLEAVARRFVNFFYPPPPPPADQNKINIIYINTGTDLEAQLALFWGVVIQNSNLDQETKTFFAKVAHLMYKMRRVFPPFHILPDKNAITVGQLPQDVVNVDANKFSEEIMMKALQYESGQRVKSIFIRKFGGQKKRAIM